MFSFGLGPTCGSGQIADISSPSGCSPTNGIQPGKLIGNDTCGCNGPSNAGGQSAGEPIDIGSGNVTYHFTDYTTAGQNPLQYTRYYNSRTNFAGSLGGNWRSTYDRFLYINSSSSVTVERANGQQLTFSLVGSTWATDTDVDYTLSNSGSTWTLTCPDDSVETYTGTASTALGVLNSITTRDGYTQTISYMSFNNAGRQLISSVTDSYNRVLTFTYSANLLASVTTPDSTTISFGYSAAAGIQFLTTVGYSTSPTETITYNYGASSAPASALTSSPTRTATPMPHGHTMPTDAALQASSAAVPI